MAIGLVSSQGLSQLSRRSGGLATDAILAAILFGGIGMLMLYGRQVTGTYVREVPMDLTVGALPGYAAMSLARCLAAFMLSLIFTLIWGSIAAHHRRAERIMIPALDILQTIPVLSFLPPVTLAMITLVPGREIGLEIACIVMIFTGQAWNMAFGFYQSIKSIPRTLYEVAAINGFGPIRTFARIEVPGAMIGLIFNSMMSFAGGWFFLTAIEMFTLGNRNYRLPGIGSWLATAQQEHEWGLVAIGSGVLIVLIVATDQIVFRPLLVWAQRFKLEEQQDADPPTSWVVSLWRRSPLIRMMARRRMRIRMKRQSHRRTWSTPHKEATPQASSFWSGVGRLCRWCIMALVLALSIWGMIVLLRMVLPLSWSGGAGSDWLTVILGIAASCARVVIVLIVGSIWAIPLGLAIGRSPGMRRVLGPVVQVVASYPAPAYFVAITVALSGVGTPFWFIAPLLMLMGSQWYILFNAMGGASSIPADLLEMARVHRLSRWERFRRVEAPAMFPSIVTGWVTAAGGAWNTTIVAEYVQIGAHADEIDSVIGIGSVISRATDTGDYALLAAATLGLAFFVVLFNRLVWHKLYALCATRYNLQT